MPPTRRRFTTAAAAALAAAALARAQPARAEGAAADALARRLTAIERALGGRLGVAAIEDGMGRGWTHRAGERFPLCSVFKALACGAVLAGVDAGQERLARRVAVRRDDLVPHSPVTEGRVGSGMTLGELCAAAMTRSDNTAGNLILGRLGGPAGLTAFARSLGDAATRLDRWETALNEAAPGDPRDTTTPAAMAADLRALALGAALSPRSRARFVDWLVDNRTGDARLRAGLPRDWRVGDKTGTGGHGSTNDVAVVWPPGRPAWVVCVFVTDTRASLDARNEAVAEVGRTLAHSIAA